MTLGFAALFGSFVLIQGFVIWQALRPAREAIKRLSTLQWQAPHTDAPVNEDQTK